MARAIARYEMSKLEMLITPIAAALGIDYKPGTVDKPSRTGATKKGSKTTTLDRDDPAALARAQEREARMAAALGQCGFSISDE